MLGDAGFVVGPVTLGWLAQASGFGWALAFNAGLALAVSGLFLVLAVEPREIVLRRREPVYVTEVTYPLWKSTKDGHHERSAMTRPGASLAIGSKVLDC